MMGQTHPKKLVLIAMRVHLFPSRTQKLSSSAPTILAGRLAGKIGNANINSTRNGGVFFCHFVGRMSIYDRFFGTQRSFTDQKKSFRMQPIRLEGNVYRLQRMKEKHGIVNNFLRPLDIWGKWGIVMINELALNM